MQTLKEVKFLGLLLLLCLHMYVCTLAVFALRSVRLMTYEARWENFQDRNEIEKLHVRFSHNKFGHFARRRTPVLSNSTFCCTVNNYCTHLNISFHLAPSLKVVKIKLTHNTDSAMKLFSLNYYTQTYVLH